MSLIITTDKNSYKFKTISDFIKNNFAEINSDAKLKDIIYDTQHYEIHLDEVELETMGMETVGKFNKWLHNSNCNWVKAEEALNIK